MKILVTLLCVSALVSSCLSDPREKAISDYVQTSGNTKTDLSFELIALEEVSGVTAKDSISLLLPEYSKDYNEIKNLEYFQELYSRQVSSEGYQKIIDEYQAKVDSVNRVEKKDSYSREFLLIYENAVKTSTISLDQARRRLATLSRYNSNQQAVLCNRVKCKYKIKNPALNNAVQEITRTFFISVDGNQVLASI